MTKHSEEVKIKLDQANLVNNELLKQIELIEKEKLIIEMHMHQNDNIMNEKQDINKINELDEIINKKEAKINELDEIIKKYNSSLINEEKRVISKIDKSINFLRVKK